MPTHAINLSTAWAPLTGREPAGAWLRRFGRPGGLEAVDRVRLVIEAPECDFGLLFNGRPMPNVWAAARRWEADVTGRLLERNELLLTTGPTADAVPMEMDPGAALAEHEPLPRRFGSVRLEIVSPSA